MNNIKVAGAENLTVDKKIRNANVSGEGMTIVAVVDDTPGREIVDCHRPNGTKIYRCRRLDPAYDFLWGEFRFAMLSPFDPRMKEKV